MAFLPIFKLYRLTGNRWVASGRPQLPQSWNRYAYVLNNPLVLIDPDGLQDRTGRYTRFIESEKAKIDEIVESGGDTYTIGFLGIYSPDVNASQTARAAYGYDSEFDLGDLTAANVTLLENDNNFIDASSLWFFGQKANDFQVQAGVELVEYAQKAGLNIQFFTHSNGVQSADKVIDQILDKGKEVQPSKSLVVAPNTSQVSDIVNIAQHSRAVGLVNSNNDEQLSRFMAANKSTASWQRALRKEGITNVNVIGTSQKGHGAQHYLAEIKAGNYVRLRK